MQAKGKNKLQKLLNKRRQVDAGKWSCTTIIYNKLCNDIAEEQRKQANKLSRT